jgi:hypothetical protein
MIGRVDGSSSELVSFDKLYWNLTVNERPATDSDLQDLIQKKGLSIDINPSTRVISVKVWQSTSRSTVNATPNPSIERTCPGKPGHASHVKLQGHPHPSSEIRPRRSAQRIGKGSLQNLLCALMTE